MTTKKAWQTWLGCGVLLVITVALLSANFLSKKPSVKRKEALMMHFEDCMTGKLKGCDARFGLFDFDLRRPTYDEKYGKILRIEQLEYIHEWPLYPDRIEYVSHRETGTYRESMQLGRKNIATYGVDGPFPAK